MGKKSRTDNVDLIYFQTTNLLRTPAPLLRVCTYSRRPRQGRIYFKYIIPTPPRGVNNTHSPADTRTIPPFYNITYVCAYNTYEENARSYRKIIRQKTALGTNAKKRNAKKITKNKI